MTVIVVVLASVAVPAFSDFVQRRALASASLDVHAALRPARGTAVTMNVPIVFCAGSPSSGCSGDWSAGRWMIFRDEDRDGDVANEADVLRSGRLRLHPDLVVSANGPLASKTVFLPQGHSEHVSGAFGAGRVRLCLRDRHDENAIDIVLSAAGRARSEGLSVAPDCPAL